MPNDAAWSRLFETAARQVGLFSTDQARDAGCSRQLLAHHVRTGRVVRLRRGIYRLARFGSSAYAHFVEIWLWSGREGVFSHMTALGFHGVIDLLAWPIYMTVPKSWKKRRLRQPDEVALRYADLPAADRTWHGPVPVTTTTRALADGGHWHVPMADYLAVVERARHSSRTGSSNH